MKRCPFCAEAIQEAAVVCRFCDRPLRRAREGDGPSLFARVLRGSEVVLGVGALALVGYLVVGGGPLPVPGLVAGLARAEEPPPPAPFVLSLLPSRSLQLAAGDHFDTTFVVTDSRPCTFSGHVQGLSGGNRDLEVYLLDEDGYDQWHDEVRPTAVFASGRTTSATLDVPLPRPGKYALLLSNRFSLFTEKTVQVDAARVTCQ